MTNADTSITSSGLAIVSPIETEEQTHPNLEGAFEVGLHFVEICIDGTQKVIRRIPQRRAREPSSREVL